MKNPLDTYTMSQFLDVQDGDRECLRPSWWKFAPKRFWKNKEAAEYYRLMDAYIREIGLPPRFKGYLDSIKEYAYWLTMVYAGETDCKVNAQVALLEAEALMQDAGGHIMSTFVDISKRMGYRVDPKSVTIREFYIMIQDNGKGTVKG